MEKNIVMETSKKTLNELARRDGLEGWPKPLYIIKKSKGGKLKR